MTRLGMLRWLVLKNTFNDSAVVDGRLAIAAKSGDRLAPAVAASMA